MVPLPGESLAQGIAVGRLVVDQSPRLAHDDALLERQLNEFISALDALSMLTVSGVP